MSMNGLQENAQHNDTQQISKFKYFRMTLTNWNGHAWRN